MHLFFTAARVIIRLRRTGKAGPDAKTHTSSHDKNKFLLFPLAILPLVV